MLRGFQRGVFARGGISIIGVARALIAITNFASNPCEKLRVYIGFNKEPPHEQRKINNCDRCAHPPQLLRFAPPLKKKPFGNPQSATCQPPLSANPFGSLVPHDLAICKFRDPTTSLQRGSDSETRLAITAFAGAPCRNSLRSASFAGGDR